MLNVVTPGNLGNEFDLGTIEANKLHIKFDGTSVIRDPGTGTVYAAIYDPMPAGHIEVSKTALTGIATAYAQTTQINSTITTYAWTGTGVTFASPSALTTSYTVTTPGEYTLQCVVTNSDVWFEVFTKVVKHDRIIEVMGQDSEQAYFDTLQAAHDWINTNDSANSGLYRIHVMGPTNDTAAINITLTQLVIGLMGGNSAITKTINSQQTGPLYIFGISSGEAGGRAHIATTGTDQCIVATGGNVLLKNLTLLAPTDAINAINRTAGTGSVQLDGCRVARGIIAGVSGSLQVIRTAVDNLQNFAINYSGGRLLNIVQSTVNGIVNWTGGSISAVNNRFQITLATAPAAAYAWKLVLSSLDSYVSNNLFLIASAGGAVANHGIAIKTTGGSLMFTANTINVTTALTDAAINYDMSSTAPSLFSQNAIRRDTAAGKVISAIDITTFVQSTWLLAPFHNNTFYGTIPAGTTYSASSASGSNTSV